MVTYPLTFYLRLKRRPSVIVKCTLSQRNIKLPHRWRVLPRLTGLLSLSPLGTPSTRWRSRGLNPTRSLNLLRRRKTSQFGRWLMAIQGQPLVIALQRSD